MYLLFCRRFTSTDSYGRNSLRTTEELSLCLEQAPYGRDSASSLAALSPYGQENENYIERVHGSTSIVLQEAPQLTTPPVFLRTDQSSTPPSTSAMLQLTCRRHPRRPYWRQQAHHPTFCALLTLQRTSSLALPQDPSPSCSILTFGRLSFADHTRAFSSSGDYSTVHLWTTSTRFGLRETFITSFTFPLSVYFC